MSLYIIKLFVQNKITENQLRQLLQIQNKKECK